MIKRLVIISGTSRGLGFALAQQFTNENTLLIGIARSNNSDLAAICHKTNTAYQHITADLSRPQGSEYATQQLEQILLQHPGAQQYWLINNAGTVAPIAQAHQLNDAQSIAHALQLNIGSVVSLTAAFLTHSPTTSDRRILNISSGAGRNPIPGWGVYGATKAAIDYYSQTLTLEHPEVRTVSLAPGIIDTDMQADIRASDKNAFPNHEHFVSLHQNQQLASASFTAEKISQYLANNDFGTKTIDDIRHYS